MSRRLAAALLAPLLAVGCCRPCAPRCGEPCGRNPCVDAGPVAAPTAMPVPMPVATQPPMPVPMPAVQPPPPYGGALKLDLHVRAFEMNAPIDPVTIELRPPPPAPTLSANPATSAQPEDEKLFLQVHGVADLVNGDETKMERLLAKVRAFATVPGGSVAQQGLSGIVVKAPKRVQALVESVLGSERQPLRLKYFDVKDLIDAHPTLLDGLRPLLGSVEGRTIDLKNGTLIVRASSDVLDAVTARLEALRAPK